MSLRRLRQQCEARLREIDVPDPFDIETFCARLAERRGRPLQVLPLPEGVGPEAPCGFWMATHRRDIVFVEAATSPLHREHIILHEVAHIICGHAEEVPLATFARLLPHLDVAMVGRVLGRTSYTTDEEREAELLASLILARVRRARPPHSPGPAPDVAAVLNRAARTLGEGRD